MSDCAILEDSQAFGKLEFDAEGKIQGRHLLIDHMIDVAACFCRLSRCQSIRRALERCAGRRLTEQDIARLAVLAFLHDVGKANSGFQAKRWKTKPPPGWPAPAGHTNEALCIADDEALLSLLPVVEMSSWGSACSSLWRASISHHGQPIKDPTQVDPRIWRPVISAGGIAYDPRATLGQIGLGAKDWFGLAFETGPELPDRPEFAHLFAGLVQFADWLGSDSNFFPFAVRNETVWQQADRAIRSIGMDVDEHRRVFQQLPDFATVFKLPSARPIQAKMAEAGLGALLILESETGSGKTEAALWRFAHLFQAGHVDSLYFALPTRVAATQLYNRALQFADQLWLGRGQDAPLVVRALAGYASADGHEIKCKLPNFGVLWADDPDECNAHKRWAAESSKRYLAAPLAVGTIDQALLSALQVRHAHMRHALLCRSLLVVDEVHASDAYMSTLLAHLLKAHLNAGGHALLLSATLGVSARHRYQKLLSPNVAMPSLAGAIATPYPALSDGATTHALPDSGRSKQVHWHVKDWIDSPDEVAARAIDAARQGAKVLVIRNTVPAALDTFRAIEQLALESGLQDALFQLNNVRTVHHSRYSREDRPRLDQAVEEQIGKRRAKPLHPCIVVGTQTLEQSLDIDADLLITDLCPMDVLLQRVGRLHRHDRPPEERPGACQSAQAVVLVPHGHTLDACLQKSRYGLGRFHNGGGIYTDLRILEATRRLISDTASHQIPQDNRALVEQATHPDVMHALEDELGDAWRAHGQAVDGEFHAEKVQANLNVLPFNKHFIEVDDNGYELDALRFPGKDQQISSRLGAGDYLLTFDPPQPGPFGNVIHLLPMRHHMWPKGASPDEQPVVQSAIPGEGFTFTLAQNTYRYSRLGLERITDPSSGANP